VDILARRSAQKVIVIEAIKLIESPLRQSCDTLWVTYAPTEIQMARLMQKRGLDEATARQRVAAQGAQDSKLSAANVIVRNEGSFEETWKQVNAAWKQVFPSEDTGVFRPVAPAVKGQLSVEKARPRQAAEIAELVNRLSNGQRQLTSEDIMAAFGEKAFIFLKMDNRPVGLAGWQVENLVARTDDVYIEPNIALDNAMKIMLAEVSSSVTCSAKSRCCSCPRRFRRTKKSGAHWVTSRAPFKAWACAPGKKLLKTPWPAGR
jgi:dephospho-CoA kinase